jgi:hypothetical protein
MKVFRSIATLVLTLVCVVGSAGLAAAQTHTQPAAPAAALAGTWNMSLIGDHVIPVALVLEQNGTELKGTFIMMGKDFPVTGAVNGSKFTLTGKGPAFGRPAGDHNAGVAAGAGAPPAGPQRASPTAVLADMTINGTADNDGALAGEMLSKFEDRTGTIKWTAERLKERKVPTEAAASTAAVDMTGKWTLSIVEAQVHMAVDLKQAGSKVTGTATSDHLGAMTLEGTLANGVLKFATAGSVGGQDVRLEYTGKYRADGTFAGDLSSQMGAMTWTLAQAKK